MITIKNFRHLYKVHKSSEKLPAQSAKAVWSRNSAGRKLVYYDVTNSRSIGNHVGLPGTGPRDYLPRSSLSQHAAAAAAQLRLAVTAAAQAAAQQQAARRSL